MVCIRVEQLESRFLAGGLQPSDTEQLTLELLNAARANPAAYGQGIGLNLNSVAASHPLAFNLELIQAARLHSQDMRNNNFFAHDNLAGQGPGDRIDAAGYNWTAFSESIAAGFSTPAAALAALIIDEGVPDLGHRKHLLAMTSLAESQLEVGIGFAPGGSGGLQNYYTIDTARDFNPSQPHDASITGVIYDDADLNNFYSIGEGFSGVTVTAVGPVTRSITSFNSGGYSLAVPSGTYQVTASGNGFASQTFSVTIGNTNVKRDFIDNKAPPTSAPVDQLGVFRGAWFLDTNGSDSWDRRAGGDTATKRFGNPDIDVAVAIDFNDDGSDEKAYFRNGNNLFVDLNNNDVFDPGTDPKLRLGNGDEQVVVGDWDFDGDDDIGVLHDDGRFQLDTNDDLRLTNADESQRFMDTLARDMAISGDWNGDGFSDVGIFRRNPGGRILFFLDMNDNRSWDGATLDRRVNFGVLRGAKPAILNYDSDPTSELAMYSKGRFRIDADNDMAVDTVINFVSGPAPAPGQWD